MSLSQSPKESHELDNSENQLESPAILSEMSNHAPEGEKSLSAVKDNQTFISESGRRSFDSQTPPNVFDATSLWSKAWWLRLGGYAALAVGSFVIFLYFTFPFAILKETLVAAVSEQMRAAGLEMRINIGSLRPNWVTGVVMQNVTITNLRDSDAQLKFEDVSTRFRLLPLFLGRAGFSLEIRQGKGSFVASVSLPISGLLQGAPKLSEGDFVFKNFAIDGFVAQGLGFLKGSSNPTMGLILPLISVTTAGGNLNGRMNLDGSELTVPERLNGKVELDVKGMFLHIADNVWQIPRQEFSSAHIDASIDAGAIVIGPSTRFVAPDLDVGLGGRLTPARGGALDAALKLKLSMRRRIQQNIGNLVPAVLKCLQPLRENALPDGGKEMVLEAKLNGPIVSMVCDQS